MSGLDIIAAIALQNQDNIIENSPISLSIEIYKNKFKGAAMFGYEEKDGDSTIVKSKGIIKFTPDRSFLKVVGIFYEHELPIIGFFKYSDGIVKGDTIKVITKDKTTTAVHEFQIVDIKTRGYSQTQNKIYILAPIR